MFLVGAIKRGLTIKDFEEMTIGMMLDYFQEYDGISDPKDEDTVRSASQEDFDRW